MASLTNLRQLVADVTRDVNYRIRPTATVDRAINSAYTTVQQELENFIDTTNATQTITIIPWTAEYTLPSLFLKLQTVTYNNIALFRTERKKIIENGTITSTGSPIYYYIKGNEIWLYPTPQEAGTISIEYTALLPTITTSEDSQAPELLDQAIAYKAVTILFKQVQKIQEAQVREQEYQQEINLARLSLLKDENLTYRKVGTDYPTTSPKAFDFWY